MNLSRLIAYADSADVTLQRDVAERLANEAVNLTRQVCSDYHSLLLIALYLYHNYTLSFLLRFKL